MVPDMGNMAGVKRNFQALERRRMRAARLLERGWGEAAVARQVGVHRQSVNRWAQQLAAGGPQALRKAARAGRKPRLSAADRRRIVQGLKRGPEALGYETGLWTSWRVADLIEGECGIRYTSVHVGRILRDLGWSGQRPVGRALERNEKAIRRWKQVRWPGVKKTPKDKGERSFSSTKRD
jgi:transposase